MSTAVPRRVFRADPTWQASTNDEHGTVELCADANGYVWPKDERAVAACRSFGLVEALVAPGTGETHHLHEHAPRSSLDEDVGDERDRPGTRTSGERSGPRPITVDTVRSSRPITPPPGSIVMTVRIDAPRAAFARAGRLGHEAARRVASERRTEEREQRAMRGRADVFELKARLGSWPKVLTALQGTDEADELVVRARAWVMERALGPREGGGRAAVAAGDLMHLDESTLRRWANTQMRYATDADFDDGDWT